MPPVAASPLIALPFFEFMLYGANAFAITRPAALLVPVARGRHYTLVAPRAS